MNINLHKTIIALWLLATASTGFAASNGEAKQFKFSTTIEKERPELNEETKRLVAAYRSDPSEANRAALRRQVEINYDKVIERKKGETGGVKANCQTCVQDSGNAGDCR